jgi:hypothetical protein
MLVRLRLGVEQALIPSAVLDEIRAKRAKD